MSRADSASAALDQASCPALVDESDRCPVSGTTGTRVDLVTVKALLTVAALRRLDGKAYRFCPEPSCDLVYFDRDAASVFMKQDLSVRVGLKETEDPIPVCYCFGFTVTDLRDDLAMRGDTDIPASITAEVRAGHCACEVKNPEGSCCLGNVSRAMRDIEARTKAPRRPGSPYPATKIPKELSDGPDSFFFPVECCCGGRVRAAGNHGYSLLPASKMMHTHQGMVWETL